MKRATRTWLVTMALIGTAHILGGCVEIPIHEATRTLSESFAATGAVELDVYTSNGRVTVQGVEGQTTVEVIATIRSRGDTLIDAANRAAKIVVEMTQNGSQLVLSYDANEHPWDVRRYSGVEFEITVPTTVDAEVDTSNGTIEVSDIVGILCLDASNGTIDVSDAIGEVDASTSNGAILVDTYEGILSLETSNGRIEMENVVAVVNAQTSNGRIGFTGALVDGIDHRMITHNGRIDVMIPSDASVMIEASTSNGTISTNLPLIGDTQGNRWSAALNPPTTAILTLGTSNAAIVILGGI